MLNIVIRVETVKKRDARVGGEKTSVAEAAVSVLTIGKPENQEQIPGVLMQVFMESAKKFVDEHGCMDCPSYRLYNSAYVYLKNLEKEIHKELGENGKI